MEQIFHLTTLPISFKHCDPAGIVFYPRYVEMINDVVEHWFAHGLGCDFAALHGPRALAVPVVSLQVDFQRPGLLGETLTAQLSLERLGTSSITIRIVLRRADTADAAGSGEVKLSALLSLVFVGMADKRPVPIPADLREAARPYAAATA
ncbi:4-hydroxybenzoyl-CoA thioesterase [Pseudacidovorax sp. 1753]|uniref:acyl-CoA thioesterase n=1 Tax=Pseudacidovorax sp. 1753 TaxID=3156419 RepID=UPI003398DDF7